MREADSSWYAVRCIFASGWPADTAQTYEERITLWRAASDDEAIALAEDEARDYAGTIEASPDTYLGLAQSYRLADEPGVGAEVFSLLRTSDLAPEQYLDTFLDNGGERQRG